MKKAVAKSIPVLAALAVGAGIGFYVGRSQTAVLPADSCSPAIEELSSPDEDSAVEESVKPQVNCVEVSSEGVIEKVVPDGEPAPASKREAASPVVVTIEEATEATPELTAAHQRRQARRRESLLAREGAQRDFFQSVNPDWMTESQKALHAEFIEARTLRDELREQVRELRRSGQDVPPELQARMNEAQSVLKADYEDERKALISAAARAYGVEEEQIPYLLLDLDAIRTNLPTRR